MLAENQNSKKDKVKPDVETVEQFFWGSGRGFTMIIVT